ncbi:MAG: TetR/AcrR family transcriptional regulator, partial [Streptomycetaceae bacterium]|nr:TetR/AcrR family transcriptional regulator [Streptomycetaceae bacterium]
MTATRTARDRARAQLTHEIKDAARRQVAVEGAQRLSLRA